MVRLRVRTGALAVIGAAVLVSCGDSSAPLDVNLRVSVTTVGVDLDPDGYLVRSAEFEYVVAADDSRTFYRSLSPGAHRVRLEGLAPNCTPASAAEVDVVIVEGQLAAVEFAVECRAILGFVRVRTVTSGRDYPLFFPVSITAGPEIRYSMSVPPTGAQTFALRPDTYHVSLALPANCEPIGPAVQATTVTNGQLVPDTATVDFTLQCTATTGDIRVVTVTTGPDVSHVGYPVWLDGVQQVEPSLFYYGYYDVPVLIPANGERYFLGQGPGEHTVELRELPVHCTTQGPSSREVSVAVGEVSEARFDVDCTAQP